MKHLAGAAFLAAMAASLTFAATGVAATSSSGGVAVPAAAKAKLPALPAYVKSRHKWVIGVKCDFPPFGYIDYTGAHVGYDVAIARRFAQLAFGSKYKVKLTCVTTPSRIPALQTSQVDIIISTLTWTADRERVIDYSVPYYNAAGRLLVKNNVTVGKLATWMPGKKIVSTSGSIYDRWTKNCFKNTTFQVVSSPAAGVLAVKNDQADAMMYDDAFLVGVAANDKSLKLSSNIFLKVPWGIGIRKNEPDMKRWVDAAVRGMRNRDLFWSILKRTIPRRFWKGFKTNAPSPTIKLQYPRADPPENNCPS